MNPSREEALFELALAKLPDERAAWLTAACGDDVDLRRRVEALLAAHDQHSGFLPDEHATTHATPITIEPSVLTEGPGTVIGRYKLLEKLGEGGFGSVWAAEQREPVRRRVALKIIKLGMDTKQVVARFEAERQALALMDHPNIAKVLDAGIVGEEPGAGSREPGAGVRSSEFGVREVVDGSGESGKPVQPSSPLSAGSRLPTPLSRLPTTGYGRPYFVMELVRGISITKYCEQEKLDTKARLDLFIKVCHAIQHAHQKGIIHRDIKPSNILVTLHDGVPVPKVIDFGIAKATQQELTELTIYTQHHQFIGTPAYMSPEQAEMSGLDIDTRSDIYSLGVLLYELLTGTTPFDTKELLQSGLDEMRKIIREREPVRPSTRLSQTRSLKAVSDTSKSQIANRKSQIDPDLDWIVLKCLEKDRTRRYETANGLAADLKRHLTNEPVVARPPSATYRFRKLVRRNKFAFAATGAIAVVLVLGVLVSTWQAIVATHARARALEAASQAQQARLSEIEERQKATEARDRAQDQELRARRNLYVANMALAYQALRVGHLGRARELQQSAAAAALPSTGINTPPGAKAVDLRGWEWRYLWSQTRGDDQFILGRHDPIAQVALWLPDGVRALSAGKDGLVKLWSVDDRRLLHQVSFHDRVNGLALSPEGTRFVAGLGDGHVSLWDLSDLRSIWQVTLPHEIGHVTYSPDGELIAIAGDDQVTLLRSRDGSLGRSIEQSSGRLYAWKIGLAFSPDSQWLAYGTSDAEVRLLNLKDGTAERLDKPEGQDVLTLAFSRDARYLASGDRSVVTIWDWQARRIERVFRLQHNAVCLAFSPDGTHLASANADQTIKLWETKNWTETATLRGHEFEIWSMAFSPDSQRLISSAKDDTVRVWGTEPAFQRVETRFRESTPVAASRDGTNSTLLVVNPATGEFITYRVFTGQRVSEGRLELRLVTESSAVELISSQLAVVGFHDGHLELIDLAAQRRVWSATNHSRSVMALSSSARSGQIAVGYEDGRIDLLRSRSGMVERSLQAAPLPAQNQSASLALSQNGKRLLAAPFGSMELPVWNLENGEVNRLQLKHREGLLTAALSDDGEWVVTTSFDAFASLWDISSGRELAQFSGGFVGFHRAAISPDKTRVALCRYEGEVSVWDPANEQPMATLAIEGGYYPFIAWDPSSDCIATASGSQLHLWRAPSWEEIAAAEAKEKTEIRQP